MSNGNGGITGEMPASLAEHQPKYHAEAWREYTIEELGWWVKLFTKRAGHRSDPEKKAKDLHDAANYADMLALAEADELR